jgi:hypothetical protein
MHMRHTSNLVFPYDPGYTGHWEAEKRREETREWLRQRKREKDARSSDSRAPEMNVTAERKRGHSR